jgi:hypothetical protein
MQTRKGNCRPQPYSYVELRLRISSSIKLWRRVGLRNSQAIRGWNGLARHETDSPQVLRPTDLKKSAAVCLVPAAESYYTTENVNFGPCSATALCHFRSANY